MYMRMPRILWIYVWPREMQGLVCVCALAGMLFFFFFFSLVRDALPKRVDVDLTVRNTRKMKIINWIDPTDKVVF